MHAGYNVRCCYCVVSLRYLVRMPERAHNNVVGRLVVILLSFLLLTDVAALDLSMRQFEATHRRVL